MRSTDLIHPRTLAWRRPAIQVIPIVRDLLLVAVAGIAVAWLGQLLGRHIRLGLGMPLVGSLAVTLPRAILLLALRSRLNRPAVLTAAALAEVLARLAMGVPALIPMAMAVPLVAGAAADAVWTRSKACPFLGHRLVLTGAVLAGARVLAAWAAMAGLVPLSPGIHGPTATVGGAVVAANVLLGAVAGILASRCFPDRHKGQ